jgi:hypothetical protein
VDLCPAVNSVFAGGIERHSCCNGIGLGYGAECWPEQSKLHDDRFQSSAVGLNVGQSSRNFMTIVFRARQWGREPFLLTERCCADIGAASSGKFLTVVFSHDIHRAGDSDKRFLSPTRGLLRCSVPDRQTRLSHPTSPHAGHPAPRCQLASGRLKAVTPETPRPSGKSTGSLPHLRLSHSQNVKISPALHRYSFFRSINVPPRPHHSKSIKSQSESIHSGGREWPEHQML